MNLQSRFLSTIHLPGTVTQYGEINKVYDCWRHVDIEEIPSDKNIYFVSNVEIKDPLARCSDKNIKQKNYVFFDFDLVKDYGMDENEMFETAEALRHYLVGLKNMLSDWSYIIYTGGGLHIYYLCDPTVINKEAYARGYDFLCGLFEKHTFIRPDPACKSLARLARLPYTFNQKYLDNKVGGKTGIAYVQKVKSPSFIKKMQEIGSGILKKEEEQRKNFKMTHSESPKNYNRKYQRINQMQTFLLLNGECISLKDAVAIAKQKEGTTPCYAFCHKDNTPSAFFGLSKEGWFIYHCSACSKTLTL